jgi:light-regulated signal transduction histidine kinase (bacteriophytochrome)
LPVHALSNALKFNTSLKPSIKIGLRGQDATSVALYVQDNGIGVDLECQERIFAAFQRLHRREDFDGTGAGLAIVKRAVESMGGHVWVESNAGSGATFLFTVPLWVGQEQPVRQAA